jgi:hypothetical protein
MFFFQPPGERTSKNTHKQGGTKSKSLWLREKKKNLQSKIKFILLKMSMLNTLGNIFFGKENQNNNYDDEESSSSEENIVDLDLNNSFDSNLNFFESQEDDKIRNNETCIGNKYDFKYLLLELIILFNLGTSNDPDNHDVLESPDPQTVSAQSEVSSVTGNSSSTALKSNVVEPSLYTRNEKGEYKKVYNRETIPHHVRMWLKAVKYYFDGNEELALYYQKVYLDCLDQLSLIPKGKLFINCLY